MFASCRRHMSGALRTLVRKTQRRVARVEEQQQVHRYWVVEAAGMDVIPYANLNGRAHIVNGQPLALVRPDLSDEEHEEIASWLLVEAARQTSGCHPC